MMLPTTGMNHAGLRCWISKWSWWIQALMVTSVKLRWSRAPSVHRGRAAAGDEGNQAPATSRMPMERVGTKFIFTGCLRSALASAGWRSHLRAYSSPTITSSRLASRVSPCPTADGQPSTPAALCQARASPPVPITVENSATGKWARDGAGCGLVAVGACMMVLSLWVSAWGRPLPSR